MYCRRKDYLYGILDLFKRRFGVGSYQYTNWVDRIKEHIRSGHDGQPCPDGSY
jgi:hypothetical protein